MKKNILVTWYGITDLKASLNLENTSGPILSALIADEGYDEVIILGYTKKNIETDACEYFYHDLNKLDTASSNEIFKFIDKHANTNCAHSHFILWLESNVKELDLLTKISLHPIILSHLNDTENIYEASITILKKLSIEQSDSLISIYVSPGTPVMAFTWAFASLKYPKLMKRLIASPQISKPPEIVHLPSAWDDWNFNLPINSKDEPVFDIIFHLFGEQRMPSLLGVRQFKSNKHVFVISPKYPSTVMKQFLQNSLYDELSVDPFSPKSVRDTILEYVFNSNAKLKIGFNLTGGTKLMYVGAYSACKALNAIPFYFDTKNKKVINLDTYEESDILKIDSIDTFIRLNGDGLTITNDGKFNHPEKINIINSAKLIWQNKKLINKSYEKLKDCENCASFEIAVDELYIRQKNDKSALLTIGKVNFNFSQFNDFWEFVFGKWLEVYVYSILQPLLKEKKIKDLRLGLRVSIDNPDKNNNFRLYEKGKNISDTDYQEFDILVTDGYELFIIECKSGKVNTADINKLSECTRAFGGVTGKGVIASSFRPNRGIFKQKADNLGINWFFDNYLEPKLKNLFS